jgi:FKBP-type peptidyl-prolyl cis-trans isomerase
MLPHSLAPSLTPSLTPFADFTLTKSGLQYKDLEPGTGERVATKGSKVVVDWAGVTVGYYGRIFEARNKSKGGSFTGDEKDYLRITVGDPKVIPAFNEALEGMKVGGIRRILVPPEVGYPDPKSGFKGYLPAPGTFSGKRTLDFVLQNEGMMDKTLLFDIELLKIVD